MSVKKIQNQKQTRSLQQQVKLYRKLYPKYELYAHTLIRIFEKASKKYAPLSIVQARPKSIDSFTEKILRKDKYADPINEITDLCGARVITHIPEEIVAIGEFIKNNFIVDEKNSIDIYQRLKPTEFGYRSVHYVVQFKEGVFPNKEVDIKIPFELFGLKAEIQVRTILEHSWADFNHDLSYKGAFDIPQIWKRELAGLAASLESSDKTYSRIHTGLQVYASNYCAYMNKEEMQKEIMMQELILKNVPGNLDVSHRIAKIAIVMGDWQKAIQVLSQFEKSGSQPIIRDLGLAYCRQYENQAKCKEFLYGIKLLEDAIAAPSRDIDALCYLAGAYRGTNENRARELYRRAFSIDPTNPYALGSYLESELIHNLNTGMISSVAPLIETAIKRSKNQAEVGVNLQWVFYDIGRFYLFLGKPQKSLNAYAKAIQVSLNDWLIKAALRSIERLEVVKTQLPGYDWVKKLLLLGLATKFDTTEFGKAAKKELTKISDNTYPLIEGPVVIVAGRCGSEADVKMKDYQGLIMAAFRDFKGTIISGGTISGISGLVGEVQKKQRGPIKTIGYVPKLLDQALIDQNYREIRFTEGKDFSPTEPLQYWIDIVNSGISSSSVKLLGIDGQDISDIEYKIAVAFGAITAIVENSKMAAEKLLSDSDWASAKNLIALLDDPLTAWAFVKSRPKKLEPKVRELLGKTIHENYLRSEKRKKKTEPSLQPWTKLKDNLKESNFQQAEHIMEQLENINCTTRLVKNRSIELIQFTESEIDEMAQREHARWNIERYLDGWKKGPRDVENKITPYLARWSDLPADIKKYDIDAVKKIPKVLAKINLEVIPKNKL